jgi:ferredoxin-NADP reductase
MSLVSTHGELNLRLRVSGRSEVAAGVIELELSSRDGTQLPEWQPGAHVDLHLPNGHTRQYSLMSGNDAGTSWRVAILIEEDGRGGSLCIRDHLHEGDEVDVVGPRNHFSLIPAPNYLFIAGGIGVTPLIAMIEAVETQGREWKLIYLGRSHETMAYGQILSAAFANRVVLAPRDMNDRFDINSVITDVSSETHVYACGPERLLVAIEEAMGGEGIDRVHVERFVPREIVKEEPDKEFVVYCKRSGVELVVADDESILMAADFAGIDIPGDCMEGTCGACETRVFEGKVDHRDSVLPLQERATAETMMICVSRAKSTRLVIDL